MFLPQFVVAAELLKNILSINININIILKFLELAGLRITINPVDFGDEVAKNLSFLCYFL